MEVEQRIKEETFLQTGRGGGDRQSGQPLADSVVPYLHPDKPEGTTGDQDR